MVGWLMLATTVMAPAEMGPATGRVFVAVTGNDAWSGRLPEPNAAATDGPVRTLGRAVAAVRGEAGQREVVVRGGVHYLSEPLTLTPEDSGTAEAPLVFRAWPGEQPILSGGREITGWREAGDGVWSAPVPGTAGPDGWQFRQLRYADAMQILARHPNFEADAPTTGGWLFAKRRKGSGGWGSTVANIHTVGDWMEWDVDVPADGEYRLWLYYAQHMQPFGRERMDGHFAFSVDGGPDVPLTNMVNTGDWSRFHWRQTATLTLTAGRRTLRWSNRKGGGINFNAFALTTDPAWQPEGTELAEPATGTALMVVQTEEFDRGEGKEMRTTTTSERGRTDRIPVADGMLPDWDLTGSQVMIFPAWGWVGGPVQVDRYDAEAGAILLTGKNAQQDVRIGNRFYLANVREALDAPGEFFLDRVAGQLLFIPPGNSFGPTSIVVAPALDRLVSITGQPEDDRWAEHFRFEGLAFRDSQYSIAVDSLYTPDDAAMLLDGARHVTVEDCDFRHLGGYGIHARNRSQRLTVRACEFTEMGQGGVLFSASDNATRPGDSVVEGCRMSHLGTVYKHVAGVYVTIGEGIRVSHCTITDVPRYAISFKSFGPGRGSARCLAEYNEMIRTNLETNDTGAIETLGRDRELTGHIIRYNLILDVIGMKHTEDGGLLTPYYTWGIYLDDYSSGVHVHGNIVARTVRAAYHNHLGFQNVVENNIFVEGTLQQWEYNGRAEMRDNVFRRNIVVWSGPDSLYGRSSGWNPAVLRECDHNLVWWTGGDLAAIDRTMTPGGTWSAWQALGFDQNSRVADPRFVSAATDDYRLQPDSPAWALGFEPIAVERIGLRGFQR